MKKNMDTYQNETVLRTYIREGLSALNQAEEVSKRGAEVSHETLMEIIRENEDTEYGSRHHFREIHTYGDYARLVPISTYDDYQPYIDRMLAFGERNLLTKADVVYFAHTSGTTSAFKMIPRTQKELDILFRDLYQRAFGLCDRASREKTGQAMTHRVLTLVESNRRLSPTGISNGVISATMNHPEDTPEYSVLPEELLYPRADYDRRHIKMLFALRERHISLLLSTFASIMCDMLLFMRDNWAVMADEIEAGRIDDQVMIAPQLKKTLENMMIPDPERADEIRRIMAEHADGAFLSLLWPDLVQVTTIGTGGFGEQLKKVRQCAGPNIPIDMFGYVSSETTAAIALHPEEPAYMLHPGFGFYEFIPMGEDAHQVPLRMEQLEAGREYELIVTNFSGFYRYRINDVIRVVGFHNECPMIIFSYRKNQLISMYGEKMTENVIRDAVKETAQETAIPILEYAVYPNADAVPGHYQFFLESDREISPEHWQTVSRVLNEKLCDTHESYGKKIAQKMLLPCEAGFVQPQTFALYRDLRIWNGASPNQVKPLHMIGSEQLRRFFNGLLQK